MTRTPLAPFALFAALLACPSCVGTYNPDTAGEDFGWCNGRSHAWDSAAGRLRIAWAQAQDPFAGWTDGLYQAWRLEREDGTPVTAWMRYPALSDGGNNVNPAGVWMVGASGKLLAYDHGERFDSHDLTRREAAWYECTLRGQRKLPYYHVVGLGATDGALAFVPTWAPADPDAPPRERGVPDRTRLVGWHAQPHANLQAMRVVRLDQNLDPVGEVEIDVRATRELGVRGDLLRAPVAGAGVRYYDATMRPVELTRARDFGDGARGVLLQIDERGDLVYRTAEATNGRIAGPWSEFELAPLGAHGAVWLSTAGTERRTLARFFGGELRVWRLDVRSAEVRRVEVPYVLRGREGFAASVEVALLQLELPGGTVFEAHALGFDREPARGSGADAAAALAPVQAWVAGEAQRVAALDAAALQKEAEAEQRRIRAAQGRLAIAEELRTHYHAARDDGDVATAQRAIEAIEALLGDLPVPTTAAVRADLERRQFDLGYLKLDWGLRRPDLTIENLLPLRGCAGTYYQEPRFWSTMEQLVLAARTPPARATFDVLYFQGFHRMSAAGQQQLRWLYDRLGNIEAKSRYQALMAAGRYVEADQIAYQMGEDEWIQHLLTSPSVGAHVALLEIAMQRRPSGPIHEQLKEKLAGLREQTYAAFRRQALAEERQAELRRAGDAAVQDARSRRFAEVMRLVVKGVEVRDW